MLKFIQKYKYQLLLCLFVAIYVVYFTYASFLRFDNFFTGRFDLGNMDQTVWNTLHGRIFQLTDPDGTNIISRLSIHADFLLIFISPLYLLWSDPRMLLFLQSVILGLGAVFVYLIANKLLKKPPLSLTFAALYLLNPAMQFTNLYDFHAVVLATTFLLATFYFFLKRNYLLFFVFAVLAGLTKEDVWAVISLFGFAIMLRIFYENKFKLKLTRKQLIEVLFGLAIFILSALAFYLLIWKFIPLAKGGQHFAIAYYSDFGGTPSGVLKNILLEPLKTFLILISPGRIHYLIQLFSPLGFLSLLSPLLLIFAAPDLLINLLSSNSGFQTIYYQYTACITPFIFISAIYSVRFLQKHFRLLSDRILILYLLIAIIVSAYLYGPIPGAIHANVDMFTKQLANRNKIDDFLSNIPNKYSIAASNNLGSHLSHRQNIYTIPSGIGQADVILFLLNDSYAQPSLQAQKDMVKEMSDDKKYIQVYKDGDFVAFEKRDLYTQAKPKPKKGQVSLFPYSITALSDRSYQASDITVESNVSSSGNFRSYIISYMADGLKEYALMDIPNIQLPTGGFPVVVVDHGYIKPSQYSTTDSYKAETNYFANQGYLVLKPDYRGNGNSEVSSTALMRFAYPVDVLTLLSSLKNIPQANSNQIYLWSHSMGGEVTLEVLESIANKPTLSRSIKAAVFWAPVSDPAKWFSKNNLPKLPEAKITPYPYAQTFQILGTPETNPELWQSLSPLSYLKNINVPILLQHGTGDTTVPYSWSVELNSDLLKLHKNIQFVSYPNDNHNLPLNWAKAISTDLSFFKSH